MTPALARDLLVAAVWATLATITTGAAALATYWTSLDGDYAVIAGLATLFAWAWAAVTITTWQASRRGHTDERR